MKNHIIRLMGKKSVSFARQMKELELQYPELLRHEFVLFFLQARRNQATVIQACIKLAQYNKNLIHLKNIKLLFMMGEKALEYVAQFITENQKTASMTFETQSSKKDMVFTQAMDSRALHTHRIFKTVKNTQAQKSMQKNDISKVWVSKSLQTIETRITDARTQKVLIEKRYKSQLQTEDIESLRATCYGYFAGLYQKNNQDLVAISNRSELESLIQKLMLDETDPYCHSYCEVLSEILDATDSLLGTIPLGPVQSCHKVLFDELERLLLWPENWAAMRECLANAEMEVLAQELRRALCPSDLFHRNPYPKYRVSVLAQNHADLSLSPSLPQVAISSQMLHFQECFDCYGHQIVCRFPESLGQASRQLYHMDEPVGLGTACLFAKFLGDSDAKRGNIGVSFAQSDAIPVFVAIDSDRCFSRSAMYQPIFSHAQEVILNPVTEGTYYYNYFLQRAEGQDLQTGRQILKKYASKKCIKRENFITAFNLAFLPPEGYDCFINQYLSLNNPFVRCQQYQPQSLLRQRHGINVRVRGQIFQEQAALYDCFRNQPLFMRYFLNSNEMVDNIFYRYERLSNSIMSFRFYKKHTIAQTVLFQTQPSFLEDYFLGFLCQEMPQWHPIMQESVERHFKEWVQVNPYHPAFKQRCAHLLHFKFPIENIWATLDDSDKTQPITSTPLTIASTATQDSQDNTISFKKKTTKRNLLA